MVQFIDEQFDRRNPSRDHAQPIDMLRRMAPIGNIDPGAVYDAKFPAPVAFKVALDFGLRSTDNTMLEVSKRVIDKRPRAIVQARPQQRCLPRPASTDQTVHFALHGSCPIAA